MPSLLGGPAESEEEFCSILGVPVGANGTQRDHVFYGI
jgi:hypothetical protein